MRGDREPIDIYAGALFSIAKGEGILPDLEKELLALKQLTLEQAAVRELLFHPQLDPAAKKTALQEIVTLSPLLQNFLSLLMDQKRERQIVLFLDRVLALMDQDRKVMTVEVTSAVPLSEKMQQNLKERLDGITGRDVNLRLYVNEEILGGLVVRIGDRVYNGSVLGQLTRLKKSGERLTA